MRGKVENTARSVGSMVEGGLQTAESIINEYGAIDNFCAPASESIPDSVAITDCGAFNQLEKLFKEPWQIEHNFNEVVKKLKECVEKKYQGKIPSPFVSLSSSPTCVPDVLQLPMKGLLAAVRYALAQAPGAASGLAAGIMDLVDNVKSIVNRLKALVTEHVSFLQGEAYSSAEGFASFPGDCDNNIGTIVGEFLVPFKTQVRAAVALIFQYRLGCKDSKWFHHFAINLGMDSDPWKETPASYGFGIAVGRGPSPNTSPFSFALLVKAGAKNIPLKIGKAAVGVAVDFAPLLNGAGMVGIKAFGTLTWPVPKPADEPSLAEAVAHAAALVQTVDSQALHQSEQIEPTLVFGGVFSWCVTCDGASLDTFCQRDQGTLHYVGSCSQCGTFNFCQNYLENRPGLDCDYTIGKTLEEFGCNNLPTSPSVVRDSDTHRIYVRFLGTLHHVGSCTQCGRSNLCGPLQKNTPDVEKDYMTGEVLEDWGCDKLPASPILVRNSVTGAIYVVEA